MDDERLISILSSQQWERCKGELMALIALQGSQDSKYEDNKPVTNLKWERLESCVDFLIAEVEDNDLHC